MDIPQFWRTQALLAYLLLPLSLLFRGGVFLRQKLYDWGILNVYRAPVPVVMVGNLTVGGNGKTPLVIALAKALTSAGYQVGIISRGYGRSSNPESALLVNVHARAADVGDEPLLIHTQSALPVAVSKNRRAAIELLLRQNPRVNVVLSDDGLQHKALYADVALVAYAADLGFGNGFCLPAGALREPISRLHSVDALVVTSGNAPAAPCPVFACDKALCVYELSTGQAVVWQDLAQQNSAVLTAIARPERLVDTLRECGIFPKIIKTLPDHSPIMAHDLPTAELVLVSAKDAVKIKDWYDPATMPRVVVVDYQLTPPPALLSLIIQKLKETS